MLSIPLTLSPLDSESWVAFEDALLLLASWLVLWEWLAVEFT